MAEKDQISNFGRKKALYFLPGTAFPLAQPGRKAAPFTPVLFQLVNLSKQSSSLHSLRTPFPTNEQSRIGSLIGQCRGVFPRLPAASPAAAQAGLADMDPPDPPSEGRSGHQLPQRSLPRGTGVPWSDLPNSPEAEHTSATPHQALAPSQQSSLSLFPSATSPTVFGGAGQECSAKRPPGLKQRKNFQVESLLGTSLGEVTQPQASPCGTHRKGPAGALQNL